MLLNCIIDGNYILSRLVFTLHKNNLLYGSLYQSLDRTIENYRKIYPFSNIYIVSDSKEKSWRKSLHSNYKMNRKRDSDIDWTFVYDTYSEFKKNVNIKILESPRIEGDDWISYVVHKSNDKNISNYIVSNDYDIKQLLKYNLDKNYINLMSNQMYNQEKVFLPKNYQIFLNKVKSMSNNDDIFNLNDNSEFLSFMNKIKSNSQLYEIDNIHSLLVKLISGDNSDNIKSVYQVVKSGKTRGIGEKGAESIYNLYVEEFGDPDISDPDLFENIADIICEKKKISKSNINLITENIKSNMKLINLDLDNFPKEIINSMNEVFNG
jgi:5'-3' exonuclease